MSDTPMKELLATITPIAAADWTDEQWAEHDARVAEALAKSELAGVKDGRETILKSLGWPARAIMATRIADRTHPACTLLRRVEFEKTNIVVLAGPVGCGKTIAAACWALDRRRRVQFLRASTFAASSRYNAEQRKTWFDASALVLDDLGAEYLDAKGSFLVDVDELVDTFYGDLRPLIITTNCTEPSKFRERYGERVMDRLRECAEWLSVKTDSMRGDS